MLIQTEIAQIVEPSIRLEIMHDIAARYIFEKHNVKHEELAALETGIDMWTKFGQRSDMDTWELNRIVKALIANEKGYFNRPKETIKRLNIHWRQLYSAGLPNVSIEGRKYWNKS